MRAQKRTESRRQPTRIRDTLFMPLNDLTILICTHNCSALLARALTSLNAAKRPQIPANACTDDTVARMRN